MANDALHCAKRNLRERHDCVGWVECFDKSVPLMKRMLGWCNLHNLCLNVSEGPSKHSELPPGTLPRILKCNRCDVELYDATRRLISAEILAAGSAFQTEARRFSRNNVIYNKPMPVYDASGAYRLRQAPRAQLKGR